MGIDNRRWFLHAAASAAIVVLLVLVVEAAVETVRPSATVTGTPAASDVVAGTTTTVALHVSLPGGVHIQAHKPVDPLLIPTVATVTPPKGVTVTAVKYPAPSPFVQSGQSETLQVLGPEFDIDVTLTVDAVDPGTIEVPVVLRYQACNETTCFPPARASASWRLNVRSAR